MPFDQNNNDDSKSCLKTASETVNKLCNLVKHRKEVKKNAWFGKGRSFMVPSQESWLATEGYFLGDVIATGCSSVVRRADDIFNGTHAAVKIVRVNDMEIWGMDKDYIKTNIRDPWMKIRHPHIAVLHDVIIGKRKVMFVTHFACQGDVQEYIKSDDRFKSVFPLTVRRWSWQITSALKYLHKQKIAHLDLKLQNILLNCKLNVKVTDIGFAWYCGRGCDETKQPCNCTKAYVAPEVLMDSMACGLAADIWSLGVVIFALWNRCLPFPGHSSKNEILAIQRRQEIPWRKGSRGPLDPLAHNLVTELLKISPEDRPSADEVMKHDLFRYHK